MVIVRRVLVFTTILCLSGCGSGGYRAGVARTVITPTEPLWAGGYGGRTHDVSEKEHDLYAKALVIEDPRGYRLVIVTTDLLGFPKSIGDPTADAIARRFHLRRDQIMLTSSHTHCGPVLRQSLRDIYPMTGAQWEAVDRYSKSLQEKVVAVVAEAMNDLSPATLSQGIGQVGFAVNRRNNPEKAVVPGYEPKGPVDHDVPVLRVAGRDGRLRAVLFGYACHNTTMDYYKWCGDYAGFAQADFEQSHPGATAMFFMGCGGDANPLPRRKIELCRQYGQELSHAVDAVMDGRMTPVSGRFAARIKYTDLPLEKVPTRAELERLRDTGARYEPVLARRLLAELDAGRPIPPTYPYPVQAFQLGRDVTMLAFGGEMVVDYSLRLKRELGPRQTWVAAYANDVMAYIPSRRVLHEGGYEGETSMVVYGLPSKWSPKIEEMIVAAAHELTESIRPRN